MGDKIVCQECQKELKNLGGLKLHLKSHKISPECYYHKYFPRKDRYTGELIKFRNEEEYFSSDFNSRSNFYKWIEEENRSVVKDYLATRLKKLYKDRDPNYIISASELESLREPNIFLYERFLGEDYYEYSKRFVKIPKFVSKKTRLKEGESHKIIIAKNEQNPFSLDNSSFGTLKFGDYCLEDEDVSGRLRIERKSPFDFIGTLTSGFDRFSREVKRAEGKGYYLVVLVETTVNKLLNPKYNRFSKANPQFYFHNMRKLCQQHGNLQFVFCSGRIEAQKRCRTILENGRELQDIDIHQFFKTYDILPTEL